MITSKNFGKFGWIHENIIDYLIFLFSLILRVLAITIPLNVDEPLWLERGTLFFKFLLEGNLADTFIRHHPGITNMWIYGMGMLFNCKLAHLFPTWLGMKPSANILTCLNGIDTGNIPISFYILPRLLQAIITSACMVAIYILARRLLGKAIALISIILLISEPFFLAYQRFITTDALQVDFSIIGVLLLLLYLRENKSFYYLIGSGIFVGLAIASKIPTIFILPAIFIWIVSIELGFWQSNFYRRGWKNQAVDISLWLVTICLVFYLILPAMWVAPLETLSKLEEGLSHQASSGPIFFLGEVTKSPGLIFYPLTLLYRLSPTVQIGLLFCLVMVLSKNLRRNYQYSSEIIALLLVFICVMVLLSCIDRKIDRYLLLAYPELILLAGIGWVNIFTWLKDNRKIQQLFQPHKSKTKTRILATACIAIIIILQALVLIPNYPYYVTYFNPLFGGVKTAQNLIQIGQGEGIEEVARWLNQLPQPQETRVISWYDRALRPYFIGKSDDLRKIAVDNPDRLIESNFIVDYINARQRQFLDPELFSYFEKQKPLYSVKLHDLDYAGVYLGLLPLPENLQNIQFLLSLSFGEEVKLLGYDLISTPDGANEDLIVAFYWQFLQTMSAKSKVTMNLQNTDGEIKQTSRSSLVNEYISIDKIPSTKIVRDIHKLKTDSQLQSGRYQITVEWSENQQNSQDIALEVRDSEGNSIGNKATIADIELVKN